MNIKDLPQGSFQPVAPPKLNINSLPQGSYQPVAPAPKINPVKKYGMDAVAPYVQNIKNTNEALALGKQGLGQSLFQTGGDILNIAAAVPSKVITDAYGMLPNKDSSFASKAMNPFGYAVNRGVSAIGKGMDMASNAISDIPAVQKFAQTDTSASLERNISSGQGYLNLLAPEVKGVRENVRLPRTSDLTPPKMPPPDVGKQSAKLDTQVRKIFDGTVADAGKVNDMAFRARKGLELINKESSTLKIPDSKAPLGAKNADGSTVTKPFNIQKSTPNELLSGVLEMDKKIAGNARLAVTDAANKGRLVDTAPAVKKITDAANAGEVTPTTASRMLQQLENAGNDPVKIHDWVEQVNTQYKKAYQRGTIEDTAIGKLADDVAHIFRTKLDEIVDRKGYAEAFGNNQELKRMLVAVAKKANRKINFGDISTEAGLDAAISLLTGNPAYMARTLGFGAFKGILSSLRNTQGVRTFKKAVATASKVPTKTKVPSQNAKMYIAPLGKTQNVPMRSKSVSIPQRAMQNPARLLEAPKPPVNAIPLGGGVLGQKVNAGGELIRAPFGKSSVALVPAKKGAPRVNPQTGKMEKTYTTEAGKPVVKVQLPSGVRNTLELGELRDKINKNVDAQKRAIRAGDTKKVSALRTIYDALIKRWDALVQKIKDTPGKEGGFANFSAPLGKKKPSVIHPEDREIMTKFIDHARTKKPLSDKDFDLASKLAEKHGVSMDKPLGTIANKFDEILAKSKQDGGTIAERASVLTKKNGGVTISLNGDIPEKGFAFSPFKDSETIVPQAKFSDIDVDNFIDKFFDRLNQEEHHLGIWVDDGKVYMDVSRVIDDEQRAVGESIKNNQLALFDLSTFETKYIKDYEKNDNTYFHKGENKGAVEGGSEKAPEGERTPQVKTPLGDTSHLAKAKEALREAKGLSASDIMSKYPDINLKRDVTVTDIHGKKSVIPAGEALTLYELKGNRVLLQDGETYIVSKSGRSPLGNNK